MRLKPSDYCLLGGLLFVFFSFSSCHRAGNESTDNGMNKVSDVPSVPIEFDLAAIRERGTIRAIVENSSTGFFIYKGRPMGYEYDLLNLFAKSMNLELEIQVTNSISEAFEMLDNGKGDILAYSLTITKARKKKAAFTHSHYTTRQVLVQRKPANWRKLTREELSDDLIRNQVDLAGKEVHVRKNSSYSERLENLSQEIGSDILVFEEYDSIETEKLIKKVVDGDIDYTVADETVALVNAAYFPNIDVATPISFPQKIAWAVRKNAPDLLDTVNRWIDHVKKEPTYNVIHNKYFKNRRTTSRLARSDYSSMGGEKISPYDDIIKQAADSLHWDWRLLASQIYQESKFNPTIVSWAGAIGLMQLVPETGLRFGADNLEDPAQSIHAGMRYLLFLDNLWARTLKDPKERIKFVLASYNVGLGHVEDARDLAKKYGKDPFKWNNNVEYYLLRKSDPKYFRDNVVKSGYCRGDEPVNYVRQILNRFDQYRQLIGA